MPRIRPYKSVSRIAPDYAISTINPEEPWGIPVELPPSCKPLSAYMNTVAKGDNVRRATLALTKLRNNAVHPEKDAVPDGAYYHAWKLARWFIELTVLSVVGYQGNYANRLVRKFPGDVDVVPWAQSN